MLQRWSYFFNLVFCRPGSDVSLWSNPELATRPNSYFINIFVLQFFPQERGGRTFHEKQKFSMYFNLMTSGYMRSVILWTCQRNFTDERFQFSRNISDVENTLIYLIWRTELICFFTTGRMLTELKLLICSFRKSFTLYRMSLAYSNLTVITIESRNFRRYGARKNTQFLKTFTDYGRTNFPRNDNVVSLSGIWLESLYESFECVKSNCPPFPQCKYKQYLFEALFNLKKVDVHEENMDYSEYFYVIRFVASNFSTFFALLEYHFIDEMKSSTFLNFVRVIRMRFSFVIAIKIENMTRKKIRCIKSKKKTFTRTKRRWRRCMISRIIFSTTIRVRKKRAFNINEVEKIYRR